jgi:hypothetical protein
MGISTLSLKVKSSYRWPKIARALAISRTCHEPGRTLLSQVPTPDLAGVGLHPRAGKASGKLSRCHVGRATHLMERPKFLMNLRSLYSWSWHLHSSHDANPQSSATLNQSCSYLLDLPRTGLNIFNPKATFTRRLGNRWMDSHMISLKPKRPGGY